MKYHLLNDKTVEPTLMEMTQKALQMVSKNRNGYVLLIESGRIDHAHHENRAKLALEETAEFHRIVEYVRSYVDLDDTLILVMADHSHTMSISGYPPSEIHRNNRIVAFLYIFIFYSIHRRYRHFITW